MALGNQQLSPTGKVQRLNGDLSMNNTFRQYAIEIIQSSDSDSVAKIKEAMEVFGISQETVYYRIRTMFGDKLRELRRLYFEPQTHEVVDRVINGTIETFREWASTLPASVSKGLLDRHLGVSTFHAAKKKLALQNLDFSQNVFNPCPELNRSILAAARLGDSSMDVQYGRMRTEHCIKQKDWALTKAELLARMFPQCRNYTHKETKSKSAYRVYHGTVKYKDMYKLAKEELVQYLCPTGIWWLFMDDGYFQFGDGKQSLISFAVENETIGQQLVDLFKTYGYVAKYQQCNRSVEIKQDLQVISFQQEFILPWKHLTPECMHYKIID